MNLIFVCQGEDEADDNEELNEDDDGFFVPHGYLSDDEGVEDEDVEGDSGENDEKVQNALSKVKLTVNLMQNNILGTIWG